MSAPSVDYVERIRRFFTRDLWSSDLNTRSLTAVATRFLQFCVMVSQGFVNVKEHVFRVVLSPVKTEQLQVSLIGVLLLIDDAKDSFVSLFG